VLVSAQKERQCHGYGQPVIDFAMNNKISYGLFGALFGAAFPVGATLIDVWLQSLPITWANLILVQQQQPLHWVIDTAPIFLGFFAAIAGSRQDDADEQRETSQNLASSLEWLFQHMPLGLGAYDRDNKLVSANDAFRELLAEDKKLSKILSRRANALEPTEGVREFKLELETKTKFILLGRINLDGLSDVAYWLLVTDITTQKTNDLKFLQTAKLATLGELATATAHELNQPLNHIALLTENIKRQLSTDATESGLVIKKLEALQGSVSRAGKIIDHMRTFGRNTPGNLAPVAISDVVSDTLTLLSHKLKTSGISLENSIPNNLPRIEGIASQLEQVFLNLIGNAIDAIDASAPMEKRITLDALHEGSLVVVTVSDTGGGMNEAALEKLFEPFYTTKEVGKGTGLGGSISYGIVNSFGGSIHAKNSQQGLCVTMSFPAAEAPGSGAPPLSDITNAV